MRAIVALASLGLAFSSHAQSIQLPDAPVPNASMLAASVAMPDLNQGSSSTNLAGLFDPIQAPDPAQTSPSTVGKNHGDPHPQPAHDVVLDANGNAAGQVKLTKTGQRVGFTFPDNALYVVLQ